MESPGLKDRFSRQTILPGVGAEGQAKWESASVLLAGEGPALEAAQTALTRTGLSRIKLLDPKNHGALPLDSMALVLTGEPDWRRRLNRQARSSSLKALFAWAGGSGFSLFAKSGSKGCPCLECFEASNPKAFSASKVRGGDTSNERMMGAMAATEVLQWLLKGSSPLEGFVWMNSLKEGISIRHEVTASPKCPAALAAEGFNVTP